MSFGNLTPASLGFGARTTTAGVVTMGFGTQGVAPVVNTTYVLSRRKGASRTHVITPPS